MSRQTPQGLTERLASGEALIVAEGYVFELERRGYLKAGAFVPEVVLEHPEQVENLHREFVHAGSDVVLAFTYYGHREKLRTIGREQDLERLNVGALKIARKVADDTGTLMAGNLCNSTVYKRGNQTAIEEAENMFKEQIQWACQEGADFIVAETFSELGEAELALESITKYGRGLPAVVTFIPHAHDVTHDDVPFGVAAKTLEDKGAAVVGLNCGRGPLSIMPLLEEIRHACKGPIAALPVPYRTFQEQPVFQSLKDPVTGELAFPVDLPAHACSRTQVQKFAEEAKELGVQYVGLCCGNSSHYTRILAETYGHRPRASRYSPDMSQHFIFGSLKTNQTYYTEDLKRRLLVS